MYFCHLSIWTQNLVLHASSHTPVANCCLCFLYKVNHWLLVYMWQWPADRGNLPSHTQANVRLHPKCRIQFGIPQPWSRKVLRNEEMCSRGLLKWLAARKKLREVGSHHMWSSFQNIGFWVYNFRPENCSVPCLELSVTWGDQQQKFRKDTPRQCCQRMGFFKITFLQSFKLPLS